MMDWTEIETLNQTRGPIYRAHRDRLLARAPDAKGLLEAATARGDPRLAVTAEILAGWAAHGPLYRAILAEIEAVNLARASQEITGVRGVWQSLAYRAANAWGEAALPLSWESLLKQRSEIPPWKAIAFLRMIVAVPRASSVMPVLWFLGESEDPDMLHAAHETLKELPCAEMAGEMKQAWELHDMRAAVLHDLL